MPGSRLFFAPSSPSFPLACLLTIVLASLSLQACHQGEQSPAPKQEVPEHSAAVQEVETQSTSELDQVHISEKLLDTYQQTCGGCHEQGLVGAPKTGDVNAWAPRMSKGMNTLVTHARDGFNGMPPAGLCFSCSDEDYAELIQYMAVKK